VVHKKCCKRYSAIVFAIDVHRQLVFNILIYDDNVLFAVRYVISDIVYSCFLLSRYAVF